MPTQKKIDLVEELKQRLQRATIAVGADYRGLRVQEMDQMRRRLRAASVQVKVVKNSLLRLAADQSGMPDLMQIIEGPTALVLSYEDPLEAARAVTEYAQSAPPTFAIRGAYLDGQVVSADDLKDLVRLPPKPVMLAQLAGQLQSPLAAFAGLLESPLRELSLLLQSALGELPGLLAARAHQLETAGGAPQAPEVEQEEQPMQEAETTAPEGRAEAGDEQEAEPPEREAEKQPEQESDEQTETEEKEEQ